MLSIKHLVYVEASTTRPFFERVSKITITSDADSNLVNILNELGIVAKVVHKTRGQ